MTVLDPVSTDMFGQPTKLGGEADNYLNHSKGFLSWALTVDHKRIGVMYLFGVAVSLLLGGVFALLLRTELLLTGATLTWFAQLFYSEPTGGWTETSTTNATWDFYNQMFTLHGAVMVFLFIIPAIPAVIGNFVLPIMLGAKDVAFPRLNLASWYCWVVGACFFVAVLLLGGLDTGWTFYTPYSTTHSHTAVVAATMGAFVLGFSSILTGLNFIATIHILRPPGMGWFKMPLVLWGLYATAIIQILATPVLAITLLLLAAERVFGVGIFDPTLGGDPVLYQHFFWFYSHPAVYIMILPAMGVISETISVMSRKHIFGYAFIACSSMAIALVGFLVWGHHMFTSGQSALLGAVFSLLTFAVAIPSAIKVFNWLTTMYAGSIRLATPMWYAIGFIWLFAIGGLTGLFLGALSTDIHFHDTYFVVAHFHYVMVGSTLFAFLAGMHLWWPKITGKMYNEKAGNFGALLVFIGFNLTFFIQFVAGSQGMPRRYADFPEEYLIYQHISTWGAYLLGFGLAWVLGVWFASLGWLKFIGIAEGKKAAANPWGANSLEWHTASPPPHENFPKTPVATDPYDYDGWVYDESIDGYVKDDTPENRLTAGI